VRSLDQFIKYADNYKGIKQRRDFVWNSSIKASKLYEQFLDIICDEDLYKLYETVELLKQYEDIKHLKEDEINLKRYTDIAMLKHIKEMEGGAGGNEAEEEQAELQNQKRLDDEKAAKAAAKQKAEAEKAAATERGKPLTTQGAKEIEQGIYNDVINPFKDTLEKYLNPQGNPSGEFDPKSREGRQAAGAAKQNKQIAIQTLKKYLPQMLTDYGIIGNQGTEFDPNEVKNLKGQIDNQTAELAKQLEEINQLKAQIEQSAQQTQDQTAQTTMQAILDRLTALEQSTQRTQQSSQQAAENVATMTGSGSYNVGGGRDPALPGLSGNNGQQESPVNDKQTFSIMNGLVAEAVPPGPMDKGEIQNKIAYVIWSLWKGGKLNQNITTPYRTILEKHGIESTFIPADGNHNGTSGNTVWNIEPVKSIQILSAIAGEVAALNKGKFSRDPRKVTMNIRNSLHKNSSKLSLTESIELFKERLELGLINSRLFG